MCRRSSAQPLSLRAEQSDDFDSQVTTWATALRDALSGDSLAVRAFAARCRRRLSGARAQPLDVAVFEKDDDSNHHVSFIAGLMRGASRARALTVRRSGGQLASASLRHRRGRSTESQVDCRTHCAGNRNDHVVRGR